MPATVLIKNIVDALEIPIDDVTSFLDLDTGQVETVSNDLLGEAEDSESDDEEPDLPEWEKDEWELAKRIVSTDRFLKLPSKVDVHEWSIMEDFSLSVTSVRIRDELLDAIHGTGAFRHFKSTLRRHNVEQEWYAFRAEALKQIAIEWCEDNQIAAI